MAPDTMAPSTHSNDGVGSIGWLLPRFIRSQRLAGRADITIHLYQFSVRRLAGHLSANGMSTLVRDISQHEIEDFLATLKEGGMEGSTVAKYYRNLQAFFRWLADKEYLEDHPNPMARVKCPRYEEKSVAVVEPALYDKLLSTCDGKDFVSRRDRAVLAFLWATGVRRGELVAMNVGDLDDVHMTARVKGKTGERRVVYEEAADDIDHYLVARAKLPWAQKTEALWIGQRGPWTSSGVRDMIKFRLERAGLPHIHPHQFRHTVAHNWMADDGGETDLMRLMGWRSRAMVQKYGSSAAEERALEAARRMAARRRERRSS
jgi:site-specific recombinase XerD